MASSFMSWLDEQKKRKKENQLYLPIEKNDSHRKGSESGSYHWENNLQSVAGHGRNNNDRFNGLMKDLGVKDPQEIANFRKWLDFKENRSAVHAFDEDSGAKQQRNDKLMSDIFSAMDQRQKQWDAPVKEKKEIHQNSFLEDFTTPLKRFAQAVNPFDDVSINEAIKGNVQDAMNTKRSGITKELNRAGAQTLNAATFDAMKNLYQRTGGNPNQNYFNERQGGGKVADVGYNLAGSLLPFSGIYKGIRGVGLGLKEGSTGIQKLRQLGQEGALAGLGFSGAQAGLGYAINPQNQNGAETLKNIGMNTALGAVGDPALHGLGKLAEPILSHLKSGRSVKEVANETGIEESIVQKIVDEFSDRSIVKGTNEGQELVTQNKFRLNAPKQEPIRELPGAVYNPKQLEQGNVLPEPLARRTPRTSKPVDVPDNLSLNAPKGIPNEFDNSVLDQEIGNFQNVYKQEQENYVRDQMANIDANRKKIANGEAEWASIQELQQQARQIQKNYGRIHIPEGNLNDWNVPPRFKAGRNQKTAYDIYKVADEEGFTSVDEFVKYLQTLDNALKMKKSTVIPQGKRMSEKQYGSLEKLHRSNFEGGKTSEGINKLINDLKQMKLHNDTYKQPKGDPLIFKREKLVKVDETHPLNFTAKMNPKDMVTQRVEGDFNTKPSNAGIKINSVEPPTDGPLQFKKKMEALKFKTQVPRDQAVPKYAKFREVPKEPPVRGGRKPKELSDLQKLKDIKQPQVGTLDIYRLAEKLPSEQRKRITSALDKAKTANVDLQEKLTDDLFNKVVKGLGIQKGSKESALVQDFGEKTLVKRYLRKKGVDPNKLSDEELNNINLEQLKKTHPRDWERIVEADKYFKENYDRLIEQVNTVRKQIYPNNPDKIVPRRKDYYHHFNELTGLDEVKNLFDTPSNIDPHLEGVSPFTKPKAKFQGFMQKRGNGRYVSDAVGGYLKYLQAASHSINIDPVIPVLRSMANEIADATTDSKNANKIIEALQDHANDLAGKTNPYDRVPQKVLGRKGMRLVTWLNSRVKGNMILGNLSSTLGQVGNVPLGIGKAKTHAIKGLTDTLTQTAKEVLHGDKGAPIHQSSFMKERFADKLYRRFDQKLLQQPKNLAIWMLETSDKAGTRFIWNSMYSKALKEKVKDPIKFADYETRKIVAGRGVGEVPLLQKSKTVQVFAPFTLEVGNQWKVLSEMVGEKDAAGILTFLVASYGLNKAIEQVRGMGVSYDPIDALIDGYVKKEGDTVDKIGGALGSLTGETIGNVPGGNLITSAVDTDKKVPFTDTRYKDLFMDRNPNRFGSGLTLSKAFEKPSYAILPFGASQVSKTKKGLEAIKNKAVYKGNKTDELLYPIKNSPLKNLQLLTMGTSATSEARNYYNNENRPLGKNQTTIYKELKKYNAAEDFYNRISALRKQDENPTSLQNKLKKILNSDANKWEKEEKIHDLLQ